ncbi:MAG TPA: glycine cleavage system aminomethyltransferase GcvT, partial [Chromatiales bacterium]|nr:glycine cleavage system aminomethyltransferase GcvT [Chromatiales bacterium]
IEEHQCVRERVGLFDVSHMGEFIVAGRDTWSWLNRMVTNNVGKLSDGGVMYTVLCREDGTVVDDLLVSRISDERALVVVNAANIAKDFSHFQDRLSGNVELHDESDDTALIAVQGPRARDLLARCPTFAPARGQLGELRYYNQFHFDAGGPVTVSRTGYTGELGFEVFTKPARAVALWDELMEHGAELGVQAVGLAARDTLRFEASFCLYGHELDDDTTPLEAGLRWVVKLKKGDFVGRDALLAQKEHGVPRRLIGLELDGRNIARQGYTILADGEAAGTVTSGTFSPTLQRSLCMAFVDSKRADADNLAVEVRNKRVAARQVELPFYPSRAGE